MTATQRNAMASPLHWPAGKARTPRHQRRRNPLWKGATVSTACAEIEREVERMGGVDLVVSTNLALRIDGFPRSGQPEPEPDDSGAAIYFERKGKKVALACDRWASTRENLRAIGMHLAAIRGQERWGVGTLDQAFAGYQALPEDAGAEAWWSVLGMQQPPSNLEQLQVAWRAAARRAHPDTGGDQAAFVKAKRAFEQGLAVLGGAA